MKELLSISGLAYFSIMKKLDLENWNRKAHFDFFKSYDQPFFGMTVEVDVTTAFEQAKRIESSFFLYYLYKSLLTINKIECFRYRIIDGEVVVYDIIRAGATINRPDGTFSFSYIPYYKNFAEFEQSALQVIEEIRETTGLPNTDRTQDVAYFSAIPWVKFTAIEHAMNSKVPDSVPKIAFGKWEERSGKKYMPVSVHVNHALMDGVHVGEFYTVFQSLLNEVE